MKTVFTITVGEDDGTTTLKAEGQPLATLKPETRRIVTMLLTSIKVIGEVTGSASVVEPQDATRH